MKANAASKTRALTEGAVIVAIAVALSYLKIPIGLAYGGSFEFVMVPLLVYALRRGTGWGLAAGFVFGLLKYFFAAGFAVNWASILLDYSVAYMAVGLAGLMWGRARGAALGGLIGCAARFAVHFVSGITIYAQYMPEEFLGLSMHNVWLYSLIYNGLYMLPSSVAAILLSWLLLKALDKSRLGAA